MSEPIPIVCDLTDAPDTAAERVAEYERLFREQLTDRHHTGDVVTFRFAPEPGVEAWVRGLADREHRCCGFFAFTVTVDASAVTWTTTVDDDDAARAMLAEWARLPETVGLGHDALRHRWVECGLAFGA